MSLAIIGRGLAPLHRGGVSSSKSVATHAPRRCLSQQNKKDFDVVVIGGGMVGAAFACALGTTSGTAKQRIAVVEPFPPLTSALGDPELRVSALNLSSVDLFKAIGVWKSMQAKRVAPFYRMEVWDAAGPGAIHFNNSSGTAQPGEEGTELGFMVENRVIQAALHERMQSLSAVQLFCPGSVQKIELHHETAEWVTVNMKGGEVLRARLVIGADGGNSVVRQAGEIPTMGWSYNQSALVAVVEHNEPNTTAWQRFLPYGPIAMLPMFGNYSNIVWSTTPSRAQKLVNISDDAFLKELKKGLTGRMDPGSMGFNFERVLSSLPVPFPSTPSPSVRAPHVERVIGKRATFPLRLSHATNYVRPRLALIGDAAHAVHPLAGQGVNLGFADAAVLATVLIEGLETGQDIGSQQLLEYYQSKRMASNIFMMSGIEGLKRLFDSSFFPFTFARNVGLSLANTLSPVKGQFKHFALGPQIDLSKIGEKQS